MSDDIEEFGKQEGERVLSGAKTIEDDILYVAKRIAFHERELIIHRSNFRRLIETLKSEARDVPKAEEPVEVAPVETEKAQPVKGDRTLVIDAVLSALDSGGPMSIERRNRLGGLQLQLELHSYVDRVLLLLANNGEALFNGETGYWSFLEKKKQKA